MSKIIELPTDYTKLDQLDRRLVRQEYVKLQNNLCHHCHSSLGSPPPKHITNLPVMKRMFPARFFEWPVHLHHNHETGMTIGAVHAYCNAVLWQYHGE